MLVDDLAAPFERIDGADAVRIAREVFGLDVDRAAHVETERDDTFRVAGASGAYALKLAHPADPVEWIDFEITCVEHALARDPALPLARSLTARGATGTGSQRPEIEGRFARCAPWLPGEALRTSPRSLAQARAVGRMQGRLSAALADLEHPGASRPVAWDLQHLAALRPQVDAVPAPTRDLVAAVLRAHERRVAPAVAELPWQVVHADANLDNVLVDADDPARVVAVLDFGDATRTARVFDLAIAASYLVPIGAGAPDPTGGDAPAADVLAAVADGAADAIELTADERALLPLLTACRLAQRLVLGWWLTASAPDNVAYVSRSLAITAGQLKAILPLVAADLEEA